MNRHTTVAQTRLVLNVLKSLNLVILRRDASGLYEVLGEVPDFYNQMFPPTASGPCPSPWEHSYMLNFFLKEAECFFSDKVHGSISSGIWQEEGKTSENTAFVARAISLPSGKVIVMRLLGEDYTQRVRLVRKARKHLNEMQVLAELLKLYKNKASTDSLTGLFNREAFMDILKKEIARSERSHSHLCLLMFDIDHFKKVNDNYGHLTGDRVLMRMGKVLPDQLRRGDVVARYGGEEFIAMVPDTDMGHAKKLAEKLRKRIEDLNFKDLPRITVSIGCACLRHGEPASSLIERSDNALYDAKRQGRNRVCSR